MNFEKLYSILPDFIKYNNHILNFFICVSKRLIKLNNKSDAIESQHQLFELIFLNSDFKITGTLGKIQLLYLEMLKFIDNVCEKYDLDYWLTGGTLLGAVRHGGFIPWDDDVDINMMREDYEKLIEVLPKEISKYENFYSECGLSLLRDNHENYYKNFKSVYDFEGDKTLLDTERFMFLQIAWLKPYIKIDVFPRDYIKQNKLEYFKKNYLSVKYKFNQEIKEGKKDFNEEFSIKNEELGLTKENTGHVNDGLDTLQLYPVSIHETNKIFPLKKINFAGTKFKCPNDSDYYLKVLFGNNYMNLPKIIETHNISPFIESQFKSVEEMEEGFEKAINYLKKINETYE